MIDDEETLPPTLPVSPATGLDPEITKFLSRMMAGYEAAHRTIADMAETASKSTAELHKAVTSAIQIQMKAAEEREELISKRHKRDIEAAEAAQRSQNFGELTRDFRSVAMLALKKFAGIPLTGNDSHGLQDFLKTVTPEQIEKVVTTGTLQLSPGQVQTLAATLSSLAENEAKQLEPKAEAAE